MRAAFLRPARTLGLLALACTFGCADNDLSLSILQMQAVTLPSCVAMAVMGTTSTPGRTRGVLDVAQVSTFGYIGVPVVRNNLISRTGGGGIEFNGIQVGGVDVSLQIPPTAAANVMASDLNFFFNSAGGHLDPGGTVAMFVEVLPARVAKGLASSVPKGGLLTVIAAIKPVGMIGGEQIVGGPIDFPIDICSGCLVTVVSGGTCPFPVGTTIPQGGCFPQQDDPIECCVQKTGNMLCGANAVAKM
jgi:hypothetical protein